MMRKGLTGLVSVTALLAMSHVAAETMQSHESIRAAAEAFMSAEVLAAHAVTATTQAGRLDSRLKLASCDMPLETSLPPGGRLLGNTIVGVRCAGSTPWNIYVPVKVSLFEPVAVAAKPVSSGQVIKTGDIKLVERDIASLHAGYFSDPADVVGKQAKRAFRMGAVITRNMLKDSLMVRRGQRVSLVAESGGLQVSMTGVALADGAAGDRIEIRNLSSKRVVEGTVLSSAAVQVGM